VEWFSRRKRYGFIIAEGGEKVFFHENQLLGKDEEEPQEGQPVQFHLHCPLKGPAALNVELIRE
jgi:CspA family cold shock protein